MLIYFLKAVAEDKTSKKLKTLAEIFKPPIDLLEIGPFEKVCNDCENY